MASRLTAQAWWARGAPQQQLQAAPLRQRGQPNAELRHAVRCRCRAGGQRVVPVGEPAQGDLRCSSASVILPSARDLGPRWGAAIRPFIHFAPSQRRACAAPWRWTWLRPARRLSGTGQNGRRVVVGTASGAHGDARALHVRGLAPRSAAQRAARPSSCTLEQVLHLDVLVEVDASAGCVRVRMPTWVPCAGADVARARSSAEPAFPRGHRGGRRRRHSPTASMPGGVVIASRRRVEPPGDACPREQPGVEPARAHAQQQGIAVQRLECRRQAFAISTAGVRDHRDDVGNMRMPSAP